MRHLYPEGGSTHHPLEKIQADMKVLIADDDPLIVQILRSGLRARGWDVIVAADAMQAGMFAMQASPDVIVLDLNMPGGTGLAALKRLKQSVKTSQIPVVILSGETNPTILQGAKDLGAEVFLAKPVDLDALYRSLCGLVGIAPEAGAGPADVPPSPT